MTWKVSEQYVREANDALLEKLARALGVDPDWDEVEATAAALHELALTFTLPKGENT